MDATHLADRINVEAILEFFRFARRLALEEFVTQLRLRIERFELDVAFSSPPAGAPKLFHRPRLLVRQVLQLIVMRLDSVKRFVDWVT